MGLTPDERARLRSSTERSTVTGAWVASVLLLFFGALTAMFAARGGVGALSPPWNVLVSLLPVVVFGALLTPLLMHRRADGPLVDGADPATRKAVTAAVRAGATDDPRIDDLVVDMRERGAPRWLAFTATAQLVGAIAFTAATVVTDDWIARVLLAGAAVGTLATAGLLLLRRRRLLAYRAGARPPAEPPAAVQGD
jgi:hypothetical protein